MSKWCFNLARCQPLVHERPRALLGASARQGQRFAYNASCAAALTSTAVAVDLAPQSAAEQHGALEPATLAACRQRSIREVVLPCARQLFAAPCGLLGEGALGCPSRPSPEAAPPPATL